MSEWISVQVATPKNEGYYKVKFADGTNDVSRWNIRLLRQKIKWLPLAYDYWSMQEISGKAVTHWMPINSDQQGVAQFNTASLPPVGDFPLMLKLKSGTVIEATRTAHIQNKNDPWPVRDIRGNEYLADVVGWAYC